MCARRGGAPGFTGSVGLKPDLRPDDESGIGRPELSIPRQAVHLRAQFRPKRWSQRGTTCAFSPLPSTRTAMPSRRRPSIGCTIVTWLAGEEHYARVGVHGGRSAAEMRVPLLVASRPVD